MAEVAQPKAPEVNVGRTEVLAAHGRAEVISPLGGKTEAEINRGKDFAQLIKEKTAGQVNKNTFKEMLQTEMLSRPEAPYSKEGVKEMRSKLGAGEVMEVKDGKASKDKVAKEISKEGRVQIDKLTNFLDYTAISAEINKGKSQEDVLREKKITEADWSLKRNAALDSILQNDGFKRAFPFLEGLGETEGRLFIEETIATDPALQSRIVDKMKVIQEKVNKLPEVKRDKDGNTVDEEGRKRRVMKEGELVGKLGNVLPEAVVDVLGDRYDKVQKVATEQRQQETDESLRKLTQKMDKNWISYNREDRERIVDTEKIGEDIRFLAYQGQEGLDHLLIRDLELGLHDEAGEVLKDKDGYAATWENVDVSKLSSKDKALLDRAREKYGDDYQKKLLSDFGIARATEKKWLGKFGVDDELKLKGFEWTILNQNFGEKLEKDVNKLPGGEKIIRQLKDSGIDKQKDKAGWLIALLLALGITVAGAAKETISTEFSDKLK